MKVLFAVSNENISDSIIKKYQQQNKEIISSKNVYYFNAIIKELQKDKSYDRIVISEDLEPFANNNYETIDKFLFDKLDSISDEAANFSGDDIPIILICSERRTKGEALLVKLFGIGIYSALLGGDRSIEKVCQLLNKPRTKKEAKIYYKIDSDEVEYKSENEEDVSEVEIQNILNHYKKLGKNEEKYVESFDSIAMQYTDAQLRLIAKFLPLNVKAVLEAQSPKYQEIMTFGGVKQKTTKTGLNSYQSNYGKKAPNDPNRLELYEKQLTKQNLSKPVVIPSGVRTDRIQKPTVSEDAKPTTYTAVPKANDNAMRREMQTQAPVTAPQQPQQPTYQEVEEEPLNLAALDFEEEPIEQDDGKRGRGRPRKNPLPTEEETAAPKRGRGRPRKNPLPTEEEEVTPKRGRGRPRKNVESEEVNLFDLVGEENDSPINQTPISSIQPTTFEDEEEDVVLPGFGTTNEEVVTPRQEVISGGTPNIRQNNYYNNPTPQMQPQTYQSTPQQAYMNYNQTLDLQAREDYGQPVDFNYLLTRDKKVVSFVGTTKNGTSFVVNNVAKLLSSKGIRTAILDTTQNKNSYYIFTNNEEELRKIAYGSIDNLRNGQPVGINVDKNLTVFTSLPGEDRGIDDYSRILETLIKNYSAVLIDCDFQTNEEYFRASQEIYLVQSLDVLTIQPFTAFLKELKNKNVLDESKIRIVINKFLRVRTLNEKTIVGGLAYYNDPAMSYMSDLFNKDTAKYCTLPFEEQTYAKYLEALVNCEINLNGYSKNFLMCLEKLAGIVYPLMETSKTYGNYTNNKNYNNSNGFSSNMNQTLDKMKRGF